MATRLYLIGSDDISTPDNSAFNMSAGSVIMHIAASDYTPSSTECVFAQFANSGDMTFLIYLMSPTGSWRTYFANTSNQADFLGLGTTDGDDVWVGFTAEAKPNVDGGTTFKMFTSLDGTSWTQHDTTKSDTTGFTPPVTPSGTVVVGARDLSGSTLPFTGSIYYAAYYNGIGANTAPGQGTLVAEFNASAPVEPRYRDSTGKIWTVGGSAYAWEEAP